MLVVFTCSCHVPPVRTKIGAGPPDLPAMTIRSTGAGAGAGSIPGGSGNVCTIISSGRRFVGEGPLGQAPAGATLNLNAMLAVLFLSKFVPFAGDEKPPPQISKAGLDVC